MTSKWSAWRATATARPTRSEHSTAASGLARNPKPPPAQPTCGGKGARRRNEHLHARNPKPPPAQPTANGPRTSACTTNASPPPKLGACRSVGALGCSQGDGQLVSMSMSINVNQWQLMSINVNRWQLIAINCNQWQSMAINGHHLQPLERKARIEAGATGEGRAVPVGRGVGAP